MIDLIHSSSSIDLLPSSPSIDRSATFFIVDRADASFSDPPQQFFLFSCIWSSRKPSSSSLKQRETIRMELAQRSKTFFSQQLAVAVESGVRKQLKAKDEDMERARKLNWVLEDKLRSAFAENQIWREFVRTNEVTTNLLRTNLEQILRKQ